jgi:hypothetical protein
LMSAFSIASQPGTALPWHGFGPSSSKPQGTFSSASWIFLRYGFHILLVKHKSATL